jgi:hypothetical protein
MKIFSTYKKKNKIKSKVNNFLPNSYSVLNDKISFSVFIMVSCFKKMSAYEIKFDPNIHHLGDLAISHEIISENKFFYTIHCDICGKSMTK